MRIAVTGAAGFIGSHVCERLLAAGHEVVGIDAFTRFYPRALKEANLTALRGAPGFSLAEVNLLDEPRARAALEGAEVVCHLAGRPGVRSGSPRLFEAGNVLTTEAVLRCGARRVVLASSSSVYGHAAARVSEDTPPRPLSPYGRSKVAAERVALRHPDAVVLRYFTVYGPRQRPDMAFAGFVRAALDGGELPLLGDGSQARDFTYVEDAAEATLLAIERGRPGATYNVSGGRAVPLTEALTTLAGLLGRPARLTPAPADEREPRVTAADLTRARAELGWEPGTTLAEGLALQVEAASAGAAELL
jgi:nucleoside-diphosphate-sugar epimerase